MALIHDIKAALRVTSDAMDAEVQMLADAAVYDMKRAGVNPALLAVEDDGLDNGLVKNAVTAYCKAHFGYDNPEAGRFADAYERILVDLLNSSENVAAIAEAERESAEPEGEEPSEDGE